MFLHIKTKVEIKEKISYFFIIEFRCPETKRPPAGRVEDVKILCFDVRNCLILNDLEQKFGRLK